MAHPVLVAAMPRAAAATHLTAPMRASAVRLSPRSCNAVSGLSPQASDPLATEAARRRVEGLAADGIRLICNNEEERYSGIRHCANWPEQSLHATLARLDGAGIDPGQIHAFVASCGLRHAGRTLVAPSPRNSLSRVFLRPRNLAPR